MKYLQIMNNAIEITTNCTRCYKPSLSNVAIDIFKGVGEMIVPVVGVVCWKALF